VPAIEPRDQVFLTGATGFIGGHVLRELLAAGYRVRALVRSIRGLGEGSAALEGVELIRGDLRDVGNFAHSLEGCRYLVHCAALYSFAPKDRALMQAINVAGTETLLAAAHVAGLERAVVTSSSSTVGPSHDGRGVNESATPAPHDAPSGYHASKREQERVTTSARIPAILLLPTAPIGPGDAVPTPTGRLVRDFMRGRMVARPPAGGMNLVPVEDVARANVAALTRGRPGERYLLGGDNLTLDAVWDLLAEVTGQPAPRARIPVPVLNAIAYVDEARSAVMNATPVVPVEGVRMAQDFMWVDSSKAASELGFHAGSVRDAVRRAVEWYAQR
jgi:dihydroflavonol-4-reductase